MIRVKVFRDGSVILGFSISGHSGFQSRGNDIICAGVSALSQTAVLALTEVAGVAPQWKRNDGVLSCRIPASLDGPSMNAAQTILQSTVIGIDNIAQQYPGYVDVSDEEV